MPHRLRITQPDFLTAAPICCMDFLRWTSVVGYFKLMLPDIASSRTGLKSLSIFPVMGFWFPARTSMNRQLQPSA